MIIIAVFLAIEAVKRLNQPTEIGSDLVIWLAFIAILGNGLSVLLLKRDADHNLNMKSAYLHLITDMLTSVAVYDWRYSYEILSDLLAWMPFLPLLYLYIFYL